MTHPEPRFRFLTDENVSSRIAELIAGFGHDVFESREVLYPSAADRLLEVVARLEDMIIVSHDRDFREIVNRSIPQLSNRRLKRLTLLQLHMSGPRSVERTRQCWPLVEHHLGYAQRTGLHLIRLVLLEREVEVRYRLDGNSLDESRVTQS